ncbi:14565_t:CDS:2, partial [Racocetra fulgida]
EKASSDVDEEDMSRAPVVFSAVYEGKKYALKSLNNNLSIDKKIFKETKRGSIPEEKDKLTTQLNESSYYPVFIEPSLIERHDSFSNLTLWPLFHYCRPGEKFFCQEDWDSYKIVNELFAKIINDVVEDGDLIWIHGHHLMLLPGILREKISLSTKPNRVYYEDRHVHVGIFPIGIDPERFIENLNDMEVQKHIKDLKEKFKDIKIISSIDQLDYIKGVPQKLHALDLFLSKNPEWIGKVVLVQVVKSSRWNTEERNNLSQVVYELAGKINGKFCTFKSSPIHFMQRNLSFKELLALYTVSDVFIVSSLRDGMNVLPYQYISCQQENQGVLILSEFAGAAQCLDGKY